MEHGEQYKAMNHFESIRTIAGAAEANAPRWRETFPLTKSRVIRGMRAWSVACHWFRRIRYESISNRISSASQYLLRLDEMFFFFAPRIEWISRIKWSILICSSAFELRFGADALRIHCRLQWENGEKTNGKFQWICTEINSLFARYASLFVSSMFVLVVGYSYPPCTLPTRKTTMSRIEPK